MELLSGAQLARFLAEGSWADDRNCSFFQNFRKREEPRKVDPKFLKKIPGYVSSITFCYWNFRNGSFFGNLTLFGFSGNFPTKFLYQFAPVPKSGFFWSNGKRRHLAAISIPGADPKDRGLWGRDCARTNERRAVSARDPTFTAVKRLRMFLFSYFEKNHSR